MLRRNWLASVVTGGIAGLLALWRSPATAAAELANAHSEKTPDTRLMLIVCGGSAPFQSDASITPFMPADRRDGVAAPGDGKSWFRTAAARGVIPPAAASLCTPGFSVAHEIQIGTIDELVECYRQRLLRVSHALETLSSPVSKPPQVTQAYLRDCREAIGTLTDGVTIVPFGWQKPENTSV